MNEEFSAMTGQELTAHVEHLTVVQAKGYLHLRMALSVATLPILGVVLFGDQLGIPLAAAAAWILLVLLFAVRPMISYWRSAMARTDAIVELSERGLELPSGTRRMTKTTSRAQRRLVAPSVLISVSLVVMTVIVALQVSDIVTLTTQLLFLLFATGGVMFASLCWVFVIMVGEHRAQSRGGPGGTA